MTILGNTTYDYLLKWEQVTGAELYDHRDDPEENHNLAYNDEYRDIRIQHSEKLREVVPDNIRDVHVRLF